MDQSRVERVEFETSVEAIAELGEVALQVLRTECLIRTVERILDVAEHGVNPEEDRMSRARYTTTTGVPSARFTATSAM